MKNERVMKVSMTSQMLLLLDVLRQLLMGHQVLLPPSKPCWLDLSWLGLLICRKFGLKILVVEKSVCIPNISVQFEISKYEIIFRICHSYKKL